MPKVQVQDVGGTLMIEIPAVLVEQLRLSAGAQVAVETEDAVLVVSHSGRPRYRLDDLVAGSDPRAFEQTDEDREWHRSGPVGRELL